MRREHADHLAALADVGYSAQMSSFSHRVGRMSIARVPELDLNDFALTKLLPELDPKEIEDHPEWLDPRTYDATTSKALLSVHSWVIRDEDRTILIDTCAGNDKGPADDEDARSSPSTLARSFGLGRSAAGGSGFRPAHSHSCRSCGLEYELAGR